MIDRSSGPEQTRGPRRPLLDSLHAAAQARNLPDRPSRRDVLKAGGVVAGISLLGARRFLQRRPQPQKIAEAQLTPTAIQSKETFTMMDPEFLASPHEKADFSELTNRGYSFFARGEPEIKTEIPDVVEIELVPGRLTQDATSDLFDKNGVFFYRGLDMDGRTRVTMTEDDLKKVVPKKRLATVPVECETEYEWRYAGKDTKKVFAVVNAQETSEELHYFYSDLAGNPILPDEEPFLVSVNSANVVSPTLEMDGSTQ